jgi:lysophospholipase L1-like esterase
MIPSRLLLFLLVCAATFAPAQPAYRFIRYEENRLRYPNDSSAFMNLFRKMEQFGSEGNERISVVHIGGSHVQAGVWSGNFVKRLQGRQNASGGGCFIFPYRIAKTNGQYFARSFTNGEWKRCRSMGKEYCQPLGMSGLSVRTGDRACYFGAALTPSAHCSRGRVVKVYHEFNRGYEFSPGQSDTLRYARSEDSLSNCTVFRFEQPIDSVTFALIKKDSLAPDFILYGLSIDNDQEPGYYLAALGANGASTSSFLRCPNLVNQLRSLGPDLVILSLGVNDVQSRAFTPERFMAAYDSVIAVVKAASPHAAILLTTTTDNFMRRKTSNRKSAKARDVAMELMEKHQVAVWDMFTVMGGYRSMLKWQAAGLAARDRIHFNTRGYELVAALMFEAFDRSSGVQSQKK